eukprot:COSAG03_NODE_3240_length_2127_cov_39.297830_1_plen_68_part_00
MSFEVEETRAQAPKRNKVLPPPPPPPLSVRGWCARAQARVCIPPPPASCASTTGFSTTGFTAWRVLP